MKYVAAVFPLLLAACQASEKDVVNEVDPELAPASKPANISVPLDGKITVTAEDLASEERACIIPLRVSNGTDTEISVSMFGFKVTGSGTDDSGNMFPQVVPAGEYRTARIIQMGQSCAAFDTITTQDVLCKTGEADCDVIFEDSAEIIFKSAP
jgi:hypothetical protein